MLTQSVVRKMVDKAYFLLECLITLVMFLHEKLIFDYRNYPKIIAVRLTIVLIKLEKSCRIVTDLTFITLFFFVV